MRTRRSEEEKAVGMWGRGWKEVASSQSMLRVSRSGKRSGSPLSLKAHKKQRAVAKFGH